LFTRRVFTKTIAALAGVLMASISVQATPALAETPIKFTLDWKFEGPAAGFLLALDKGYFKAEGLDVTIDTGNGSV
jgi:NitT/TauT family transport system substrate-binding protein